MGHPALARVTTKRSHLSWRARETVQRRARRGQEATGPRTRVALQRLPAGARPAWPQSAPLRALPSRWARVSGEVVR